MYAVASSQTLKLRRSGEDWGRLSVSLFPSSSSVAVVSSQGCSELAPQLLLAALAPVHGRKRRRYTPNPPWREAVTETAGGAEGGPARDADERSGRPGQDIAIVTEEEAACFANRVSSITFAQRFPAEWRFCPGS